MIFYTFPREILFRSSLNASMCPQSVLAKEEAATKTRLLQSVVPVTKAFLFSRCQLREQLAAESPSLFRPVLKTGSQIEVAAQLRKRGWRFCRRPLDWVASRLLACF